MMEFDEEIILAFIEESNEHLQDIENDIMLLEKEGNGDDGELVNKVFRCMHTIKGGAGFFGFEKIKSIAHSMENIFGLVRDGLLTLSSESASLLLDGSDLIYKMVNDIDNLDDYAINDMKSLLENLIQGNDENSDDEGQEIVLKKKDGSQVFVTSKEDMMLAQQGSKGGQFVYFISYGEIHIASEEIAQQVLEEYSGVMEIIQSSVEDNGLQILCSTVIDPDSLVDFFSLTSEMYTVLYKEFIDPTSINLDSTREESSKGDSEESHEFKENQHDVMTSSTVETPAKKIEQKSGMENVVPTKKTSTITKKKGNDSLRINLKLLDRLMSLAGELVLTRNELLQHAVHSDNTIQKVSQRVDSITSELQDAIMATRMQDIGVVFGKFNRVVRDMSRKLGKSIDLDINGEDVEIDKTIVEAIGDPLTHLVRNSIDHGLETPEERTQNGKSAVGHLSLNAFHEAGHVIVEIIDDGRGINPEKILKKAIETGLIQEHEAKSLSHKEKVELIFAPGFSTAEEVTDISGRGVGMDVVKSNLMKIGGIVDIDSHVGKGTQITIKLPLTLAIIPSLLVQVEKESFAIPQVNLIELVRIPAKQVKKKIEQIGDQTILRLRDELLPLVNVKEFLNISPTYTATTGSEEKDRRVNIHDRRSEFWDENNDDISVDRRNQDTDRRKSYSSSLNIAIVSANNFNYGIVVDALLDSSEIVVKPLGKHFDHCKEYAGATILGDGKVALILDVLGLKELLDLKDTKTLLKENNRDIKEEKVTSRVKAHQCLIVENGENEYFGFPIELVSRIEKIERSRVIVSGGQKSISYNNSSLMVFNIDDVCNCQSVADKSTLFVIVFTLYGVEIGAVFSEIVDIWDITTEYDTVTHRQEGIVGSSVVNGDVVLLLDVYRVIEKLRPQIKELYHQKLPHGREHRDIVLLETSQFYIDQISHFIEEEGFNVIVVKSQRELQETLEQSNPFMVCVDIDVDENGQHDIFDYVKTVYNSLPFLFLCSNANITENLLSNNQIDTKNIVMRMDKKGFITFYKQILQDTEPNYKVEEIYCEETVI